MATTLLATAVAIFLLVIAPIWIGAHYLTRWRMAKSLSPVDEERLSQLWALAERLEDRLDVIEQIVDHDDAGDPGYVRRDGPSHNDDWRRYR